MTDTNNHDGRLHFGTAFVPVVCGTCENLCGLLDVDGGGAGNHDYCWYLGTHDRASKGRGCHAVTAAGRSRYKAVAGPTSKPRV